MKTLLLQVILLTQISIAHAQIAQSGFGTIRIGKTYKELKKYIIEVDEVPDYAWFAPMTIEEYFSDYGGDTTSYFEMLESDRMIEKEMELTIIECSFKKRKNKTISGLNIECAQLTFENDTLIGFRLVFDSNEISPDTKREFIDNLLETLGETTCSYSTEFASSPFYCCWDNLSGSRIVISDETEPGGELGQSINMTFGY